MDEHREASQLLRPIARRPGLRSGDAGHAELSGASGLTPTTESPSDSSFTSRTRSVLNLTSSTLFGIYAPSEFEIPRTEPSTPGGPGSPVSGIQMHKLNLQHHAIPSTLNSRLASAANGYPSRASPQYVISMIFRLLVLFGFGIAYGTLISRLQDTEQVTPVQFQSIPRWSWPYLLGWGFVGILLGASLPWIDVLWEDVLGLEKEIFPAQQIGRTIEDSPRPSTEKTTIPGATKDTKERPTISPSKFVQHSLGADWNPAVRSIGAFIGIAFAIRRLPWQSTTQVSCTLALVNPVLWYLIDRSKPGFLLSVVVGLVGTAIVFGLNPDLVPAPASASSSVRDASSPNDFHGTAPYSQEIIGVGVWVASVLFCSSVCFGNIGRRLASRKTEVRQSSI